MLPRWDRARVADRAKRLSFSGVVRGAPEARGAWAKSKCNPTRPLSLSFRNPPSLCFKGRDACSCSECWRIRIDYVEDPFISHGCVRRSHSWMPTIVNILVIVIDNGSQRPSVAESTSMVGMYVWLENWQFMYVYTFVCYPQHRPPHPPSHVHRWAFRFVVVVSRGNLKVKIWEEGVYIVEHSTESRAPQHGVTLLSWLLASE